jgi:hypothetical protein
MLIDRTYIISYFLTAGLLKRFINQKKNSLPRPRNINNQMSPLMRKNKNPATPIRLSQRILLFELGE